MFGSFGRMMPPSTATTAPVVVAGFQFNKSTSVSQCRCFFSISSPHPLPLSPPPFDIAAVTTIDDDACNHNTAACRQPPSAKSIWLLSITSSHVILQFVLQMACNRPLHLIQAGGEQRICAGNVGSGHFSVDERRRPECLME
jgi:hypothetical protein